MKVLGITGGIGSGKTLVLNILKENYNAEIIEADRLGHELMEPGRAVYNNVVSYFGRDILGKDDTIDRKKLGGIVFADKDKLRKLNELSHPVIRDEILRIIDEGRNRGTELEVVDVGLQHLFVKFSGTEFLDFTQQQVFHFLQCLSLLGLSA